MSESPRKHLPSPIRVRLKDLGRHFRALRANLDRVSLADYMRAHASSDEEQLSRIVYPIERPFEIVDNYVIELTALALVELGVGTSDAPSNLRRLEKEGVISAARRRRLIELHRVRNDAQHEYPDARAHLIYGAAEQLVSELPGFLRDYARWLRGLGYGQIA